MSSAMTYEETPITENVTELNTTVLLSDFSTATMIGHLLRRHKFGLVTTYAVAISVLYVFPFVPFLLGV